MRVAVYADAAAQERREAHAALATALPDRDVDLGDLEPADHIRVGMQDTPRGRIWSAVKISANDVAPEHAEKWITSRNAK